MIGDMVGIRISVSAYAYADHVLNGHHSDTGVSVNRRRRLALDILRLLLFIFMLLLAPQERQNMFVVGAIYVTSLRNGSFGWNDLWSRRVS